MDRRDPAKPPRPGMIWSDKYKLWMDPDTRTPEEKARHEEIAFEIELKAMAFVEEHFVCPECKWNHARADIDGCCVACGADCSVEPCKCYPGAKKCTASTEGIPCILMDTHIAKGLPHFWTDYSSECAMRRWYDPPK